MAAKHSEKYKAGREDSGLSRPSIWVPTHRVKELRDIAARMINELNFKVGNQVIDGNGDIGTIAKRNKGVYAVFPLSVRFSTGKNQDFTESGKFYTTRDCRFDIKPYKK